MLPFIYNAKIIGFGPRNFLTAEIDLGFGLKTVHKLRIDGICESEGATEWMCSILLERTVTIKSIKNELGYGVEVYFTHNGREMILSDELLNRKLAVLFVY